MQCFCVVFFFLLFFIFYFLFCVCVRVFFRAKLQLNKQGIVIFKA